MAAYQLTVSDTVIRTYDTMYIPNEPLNIDRQEYEAWLAVPGNIPDPYVAPSPLVVPVDANLRINDGINAAIGAAEAVRNAVHAIPSNFNATNFAAFLTQAKALSDAFVAMLEAQQGPPPP